MPGRDQIPKPYQYLFGPVPSRRLGRSLGVDLVPFKTCTMDCIYCQLGETPCAVSGRKEYVPMKAVLAELDTWLKTDGQADHLTLAGSGEPTLQLHFGEVFRWAHENTEIPSALLTNGSLLHLPEVRKEAALADKVKVTLSAWDEDSFRRIHRPAQGITFGKLVEGERAFRREYAGELSVEVFIVDGINSDAASARKIAALVETIEPDRIDINTAVRPPADPDVKAAPEECLQSLIGIFGSKASITAAFKPQKNRSLEISEEALLGVIKRHPATCAQLAREFNLPQDRMYSKLRVLVAEGILREDNRGDEAYYYQRS